MIQQELFRLLKRQLSDYESQLAILEECWSEYPSGFLRKRIRDGNLCFMRRFSSNGRRVELQIHLPSTDGKRLLTELLEKRAVLHGRPVLRQNIRALKTALSLLQVYDPEHYVLPLTRQTPEEEMAAESPLVLPDRVFLPGQLNIGKWTADTLAGNYAVNPFYPEHLRHPTKSGRKVRSKSEVLWFDDLEDAEALFRYDSEIRLKSGKAIYADFVVLLPDENRLAIIEHFGRMDDSGYAMKNLRRLQEYADSGYVLGRDLFFTAETKDRPLTHAQIRAVMRHAGILTDFKP